MMRPTIRFWLYASLGLLPLTIIAHIRTPGHVLDAAPLYLAAIPLGLALGGFYAHFSHLWKPTPQKPPGWGRQLYDWVWLSILSTLLFGTLFRGLNIGFDSSSPQNTFLTVINRHIASRNRGRSSSLELVFAHPFDKQTRVPIGVSEEFYLAHPAGSTVKVRLRRGAWGAAWIEPFE